MDVTTDPVQYRLLSEHFQACADLSEQEREVYLAGPKVRDLSLREELRSLLRYHHGPSSGPSSPPRAAQIRTFAAARGWTHPLLVPLVFVGAAMVILTLALRAWALPGLERSYKEEGIRRLKQALEFRVFKIRAWSNRKKELARALLQDPGLVSSVAGLTESIRNSGSLEDVLKTSPSYVLLSRRMSEAPEGLSERGFCIFNPAGMVLCSDSERSVGHPLPMSTAACLRSVALGEWGVSRPYPDRELGLNPEPGPARPVLFAGGPIAGGQGQPLAFGVLYFSPAREFYPLLAPPETGELVAFDDRSLLLNNLKDPVWLRELGLLAGPADGQSALRLHLRDPGRELQPGGEPVSPSEPWAPTRMCLAATQGLGGSDAAGYRNLAGRKVVGAWTWMPEQQMGVGVEEELESVLAPLQPLRSAFVFMLTLPAVLVGGLFFVFDRFRRSDPKGRDSRLGYYSVEHSLGSGGMGDVFLATHTILNRPTAIKILRESRPSEATVARFKREARMASRLGHPNSIQIFDYGETSDGHLFYSMEYVEGLNLAQLVTLEGPLPVARSLYLLRQISGALEEAHELGLLHRDLKPSNIMVGRKGGLGDVVKILDFGIASSVSGMDKDVTRSANLVGTPAYIAPERIQRPHELDYRSDIYSYGGVAFHMLTGRSIFEGPGPAELIYQVLASKRPSPSQLRGDLLPGALEALILDCLAIEPDLRPSSMREITEELKAVETLDAWSQDEARAWWAENGERVSRFKGASV